MRYTNTKKKNYFMLIITGFIIATASAIAQPADNSLSGYQKTEVMIPMRDGVRLHTAIYTPDSTLDRLPLLLIRTPYGIDGMLPFLPNYLDELAQERYIFVLQDIRGQYGSEGQFMMLRPARDQRDPNAIDESSDTYDSIEWLLKNVSHNNGRVGMLGISYLGWLTAMVLFDPHPALKAVSPQASPADMFIGDDFHHNGAFRLSYGFEYVTMMESSNTMTQFQFDRYDTYEWYLNLGSLSNADAQYLHSKFPTWNDFVTHPNYDMFWKRQAYFPTFERLTVPTLNVAGWFDEEDFYGPMQIYKLLEQRDYDHLNYLVVGPWNHAGWAIGEGDKLGKLDFENPTARYFRKNIQAPWFAYYLKGKGKLDFPEAYTFRTGSNTWLAHTYWPPQDKVSIHNLYFHANGRLSFSPPQQKDTQTFDSYISDPGNPAPYRKRPIEPTYYPKGSGWPIWQTEDQRFVHHRPDVLSWETAPLTEDIIISGNIVAQLFASTSGTDSDWIVKLIDVYTEDYPKDHTMGGYQLMIAGEVLRGRFRKSLEKPEPVEPNKVEGYIIDLRDHDHVFQKGHKIMVQVQSTWFPLIDRNPQTYVENIFMAKESDYKPATQRVFRSAQFPSHIKLPVVRMVGN